MHFTYAEPDRTDLQQGDLLELTPDVREMLKEVHRHYAEHPDYRYLIVLTQTCDLVRRRGAPPKTPYITLAAVRPLRTALMREAQPPDATEAERQAHVCPENVANRTRFFLERLLNNNEERYFYFAQEPGVLAEDMVAFLQLSIAVKSDLHYDKCLTAKRIQLAPVFQAKLGYLVGRLYARVGTDDWHPTVDKTEGDFRRRIGDIFERHLISVPDAIWKQAQKRLAKEPSMSGEKLLEVITEAADAQPTREQFANYMVELFERDVLKPGRLQFEEKGRQKLVERLRSDAGLSQFLKNLAPSKAPGASTVQPTPSVAIGDTGATTPDS